MSEQVERGIDLTMGSGFVPVPPRLADECARFVRDQIRQATEFNPASNGETLAVALDAVGIGASFVAFDPTLMIEGGGRTFENGLRVGSEKGSSIEVVADAFAGWLSGDDDRVMLLEESIRYLDECRPSELRPPVVASANTVYWHRATSATANEVSDSLAVQFTYPGVGILTTSEVALPPVLTFNELRTLAGSAQALITQAFDGESLIVSTVLGAEPPGFLPAEVR